MVTASANCAAFPPESVAAVSLVLRDMGNGVTRILHFAAVRGSLPPREFFDVFATSDVPVPMLGRVADAAAIAASELWLDSGPCFAHGYMRPLTEDITEFLLW